jgi:hypothetical protein
MPLPKFTERLNEKPVAIDDILLDPNNPRLITTKTATVPEERIAEAGVQANTLQRMTAPRFDIDSLKSSIATSGLLQIDQIVVRPLLGGKYVVVEGNRRIAAVKVLMRQHEAGELTLSADVRQTLIEPRVLVLSEDSAEAAKLDQWVIQGIRHLSGIRPWGGYQAARAIEAMVFQLGYTEDEVTGALGLSKTRVRRSLAALSALSQMEDDEEYGDLAEPELYAYFDEVIKRPRVREWFAWNTATRRFDNEDKVNLLYSWITPDDELNGRRRIPVAESVRSLDVLLDDDQSISVLSTPGQTIDDALRTVRSGLEPEWREPLKRAQKALENLPTSVLEDLAKDDEALIDGLREIAERRLNLARQIRKK